jgi:hypothetical protein
MHGRAYESLQCTDFASIDKWKCGVITDEWKQMEGQKLHKSPCQEWGSSFHSVCHRI